ncbi:MAG: hypothetical protein D3922_06745 [Candidatus Electrothrix sp. AR1]|nr:hypothetical protein [Candidatus Electrothrix sp. AR1]
MNIHLFFTKISNSKIFMQLSKILDWNCISAFGKTKFVKSFNLWFVIVPILSKPFNALPDELHFSIFNATIPIVVGLPFKLFIFYICALILTITNILYSLYCPEIIKSYDNLHDFLKKGGGTSKIIHLSSVLDRKKMQEYEQSISKITDTNRKFIINELYVTLLNDYKMKNSSIRIIIGLLYFVSFVLFLVIVVQNIKTVIGAI